MAAPVSQSIESFLVFCIKSGRKFLESNGIMKTDPCLAELRLKAIKTAIAMTSGAYKTGLVSYFTHRDLFPSLMKV